MNQRGPLDNTTEEFCAMLLTYHLFKRMEQDKTPEPAQAELFSAIMPMATNCKIDGDAFTRITARCQEAMQMMRETMQLKGLSEQERINLAHMRMFGTKKG